MKDATLAIEDRRWMLVMNLKNGADALAAAGVTLEIASAVAIATFWTLAGCQPERAAEHWEYDRIMLGCRSRETHENPEAQP